MYNFKSHNEVYNFQTLGFEIENCIFLILTSILGLLQNFPVYCMKFFFLKQVKQRTSAAEMVMKQMSQVVVSKTVLW